MTRWPLAPCATSGTHCAENDSKRIAEFERIFQPLHSFYLIRFPYTRGYPKRIILGTSLPPPPIRYE